MFFQAAAVPISNSLHVLQASTVDKSVINRRKNIKISKKFNDKRKTDIQTVQYS